MSKDYNKWVNTHIICQIPELKLSCWGCCGRDFTNREDIEKQIKINTFEFKKILIPSSLRLLVFRDRFSENCWDVSKSGLCSNLVKFNNGVHACPLHKDINKIVPKNEFLQISKKDLRCDQCDVNYKCETAIWFDLFSESQKKEYVQWLSEQNFDHYEYSIGNVEGKIIRKFLDETGYKIE